MKPCDGVSATEVEAGALAIEDAVICFDHDIAVKAARAAIASHYRSHHDVVLEAAQHQVIRGLLADRPDPKHLPEGRCVFVDVENDDVYVAIGTPRNWRLVTQPAQWQFDDEYGRAECDGVVIVAATSADGWLVGATDKITGKHIDCLGPFDTRERARAIAEAAGDLLLNARRGAMP